MTEKVFGFFEKNAKKEIDGTGFVYQYLVGAKDIMSANLKSKSVTLEWLKKYCKENEYDRDLTNSLNTSVFVIEVKDLIMAAEKEASQKAKKGGIKNE